MSDQQPPAWAVRLQAEREARGWGPFEAARHLREAVGITRHPTDQVKGLARQITHHEQGRVFPLQWAPAYATVYGISRAELFPDPLILRQRMAGKPVGTVDVTGTAEDWDDMERRALLQLLAVLGSGATIPAAALETLRSGLDRELGVRDGFTIEDWEETTANHAYSIRVMAPTALVGLLSADIADVRHALSHRPDLDRPSMHRVSAQLAALMAMALDELNSPLVPRWWQTSHAAAASSGDRDLEVYTRGRRARCISPGAEAAALRYADQTVHLAENRPSAGLAEAHATRAVAFARRGDRPGAEQALRDLSELYERLPAEVTGNHAAVWGWPRQRYVQERTAVRLRFGDPDLYSELSKNPKSTLGVRGQVGGELKTAWARINAGDVNEGANDAAEAISVLPPDQRTASITELIGCVYESLPDEKTRALPAARELQALTTGT